MLSPGGRKALLQLLALQLALRELAQRMHMQLLQLLDKTLAVDLIAHQLPLAELLLVAHAVVIEHAAQSLLGGLQMGQLVLAGEHRPMGVFARCVGFLHQHMPRAKWSCGGHDDVRPYLLDCMMSLTACTQAP